MIDDERVGGGGRCFLVNQREHGDRKRKKACVLQRITRDQSFVSHGHTSTRDFDSVLDPVLSTTFSFFLSFLCLLCLLSCSFFFCCRRMTVLGIGVDILHLPRMRQVLARHPERFITRILTKPELQEFHAIREKAGETNDDDAPVRYLGVR